jgi:hypothetical protein
MAPHLEDLNLRTLRPKLGELISFPSGQKFVSIQPPIVLQLPLLVAPFGISTYASKSSLSLSLEPPEVAEALARLDTWACDCICGEPQRFGRNNAVTPEMLEYIYSPLVKPASGEKYAPLLKLSLNNTSAFVHEGLQSGYAAGEYRRHVIKSIIEIPGFWVSSTTKIGLLAKLRRLHVGSPDETSYFKEPPPEFD